MNLCLSTATPHSNHSLIKPGRSSWTLTDQGCTAPTLSSCCPGAYNCGCLQFTLLGREELILQHHKELTPNPPTPHTLSVKDSFSRFLLGKQERNSARAAEGWGHPLLSCHTLGLGKASQACPGGDKQPPRGICSLHSTNQELHPWQLFHSEIRLQSFPSSPHQTLQSWEGAVVPEPEPWAGQEKDIPPRQSRWHTGPAGQPSSASPPGTPPWASPLSWPASPSCW